MIQCWAKNPTDRPTFEALKDYLMETAPAVVKVVQAFVDENKLTMDLGKRKFTFWVLTLLIEIFLGLLIFLRYLNIEMARSIVAMKVNLKYFYFSMHNFQAEG